MAMPKAVQPLARRGRRRFLRGLGWVGLGAVAGAAYARFIEPRWLEVSRHAVKLADPVAERAVRLLHLSDLHASRVVPLEFIERAIQTGLELRPDLICVTGDFVTHQFAAMERYAEVLSSLPAHAPTFACLGNHDGGLWAGRHDGYPDTSAVRALLAAAGIELLHNASRRIAVGGLGFRLIGVGDPWAEEVDVTAAFSDGAKDGAARTVLLAHNPDTKEELAGQAWDLMLSGHTHGGQLRLPLVGTPFAPVRDHRFVEGLHRWNGRWLHVTKGVGNVFGVRFNCRPEISLLQLL